MKRFCLFFMVFVLGGLTTAAAVLPDISKPQSIHVDKGQLFITEGASVYIYSLKDFSLQKKFGKSGEGPREFKITSYGGSGIAIDVLPDTILVSSVGKLSFFTRQGAFKKELKAAYTFFGNVFFGLGDRFAGMSSAQYDGKNYITAAIYDAQLKKITEVCKWENPYRQGKGTRMFVNPPIFDTDDNKLFALQGNGITIDVFDSSGKKLYTVDHKYEKIKITKEIEKEVIHFFKTDPSTAAVFQYMQPLIFPEYYPGVYFFLVKNKKIYIFTFKQKGDKYQCLIFDLKGKLLKETFYPLAKQTFLIYYPLTFEDWKLYQLVENEEEEKWGLYITDINSL